jgi:hypothetical protein
MLRRVAVDTILHSHRRENLKSYIGFKRLYISYGTITVSLQDVMS